MTKLITPADVDFSGATQVVSTAMKFVLMAGKCEVGEGTHLLYPKDATVTYDGADGGKVTESVGGKPMRDYPYKPENEMPHPWGILVPNKTDGQIQGLSFDGTRILIVNGISRRAAAVLYARVSALSATGVHTGLTVDQAKELLLEIHRCWSGDTYTSDDAFARKHLSPVDSGLCWENTRGKCGWMKRDARDLCRAVYVGGNVRFQGTGSSEPQVFLNGAVIVTVGKGVNGVQPDIFYRDYMLPNGQPVPRFS